MPVATYIKPPRKTYQIPVHGVGGDVIAHALVDEDQWVWLRDFRWHFNNGYAARSRRINGKPMRILMHRQIMQGLLVDATKLVDHIDGDPMNNLRANLRVVSPAENAQNRKSYHGSTSGYRGVSWYSPLGKWRVAVMVNGKRTHVGYFADEDEAGRASEQFYALNVPHARPFSPRPPQRVYSGPIDEYSVAPSDPKASMVHPVLTHSNPKGD